MVTIFAPMAGWAAPLGEVPDPVFADGLMGDGIAIDPVDGRVTAPCDGTISALAGHAFTIRTSSGAEILTHVGLETVALKGRGFKALVREGQTVKAGDPILAADLDFLARNAKSLISPVIVTNSEDFQISRRIEAKEVKAGEAIMQIGPLATSGSDATAPVVVTGTAIVACAHGLHARPSALVANAAKRFAGEVTLSCHGRSANAKSTTALMGLGVQQGDEVTIAAPSRAAIDAVAAALAAVGENEHRVLVPAIAKVLPANTATKIHGVPAALGRAVGVAVRLRAREIAVPESGRGIAAETKALGEAIAALRARLEIAAASGDRARRDILAAHIALLDDPGLLSAAESAVAEGKSAAFAWRRAVRASADVLRRMDDARMRERADDLLDLERQVLAILVGDAVQSTPALPPSAILIAEEILPSDLKPGVAGFVSAAGGPTSHAAILAAGMNIPALVGAGEAVFGVADGADVLLDADNGMLDLNPDPQVVAATKRHVAAAAARQARDEAEATAECVTADGVRVEVFANLGKGAAEASAAVRLGAEGCGVLRTEFMFMDRNTPPDEEEQRVAYQAIADALGGRSFILRTFDIGADKPVPYLQFPPEDNPQLGLRGVRTASVWPDLLKTQLKAAAKVKGNIKVMLPMITGPEEVRAVRAMLDEMGAGRLSVGAMVETPSAGLLADALAAEADFLSIGTNDLTQYVLAIDRGHGALSGRLDALHPAVLRLIAMTAQAANAAGKTAAVCGSLAADPLAAPILVGLGISELSVPAPVISRLKAAIRKLSADACRNAAKAALALESAEAVRAFVKVNFSGEDR